MTSDQTLRASAGKQARQYDAVVVGAGFAGLYALHRLRQMGLKVRVLEAGDGVGGTWFWNRYPGARCDVDSVQYCYSFSKEIHAKWRWKERFAQHDEILAYLKFVAAELDLEKDIQFETRVVSAHFDAERRMWDIGTESGELFSARYCVVATGNLSAARVPDFEGLDIFKGLQLHTGNWPHEPVDLRGKRVGVMGNGSSGVQVIPMLAEQAGHLYVFQRTPSFVAPARNAPIEAEYRARWDKDFFELKRRAREETSNGTLTEYPTGSALAVSDEEREREYQRRWNKGGSLIMHAYNDLMVDIAANRTLAEFVRRKIAETVTDPEVAAKLTPTDYPIGAKRICIGTDYYETFNRPNVTLVDVKKSPIRRFTAEGLDTDDASYPLDVMVFATGFDALTGALDRIEITGRDGITLKKKWRDGPRAYLGVMSSGFPNLFLVTGPGSPSVIGNVIVSIEQHVEWISDLIAVLEETKQTVEPLPEDEMRWSEHVTELAAGTLFMQANSWYLGANVPGKPRVFMPYLGGTGHYRKVCAEVARDNYRGFQFA